MQIKYRPEIDGLRAIAVTAVIIYHAQLVSLPLSGGYIGVDIFFVISGYLISLIILKELKSTNNFSFANFYERRVRRIIPALFFLIIIASVVSIFWIYFLPSSLVNFSKSVLFTTGFLSNHFFYIDGQIYGGENGLYKPFLHTWSLAVEEQFYLIFPIIIFVLFKYFKKFLKLIIIISLLSSLIFAAYGSINFSHLNFYILPSRLWELLIGTYLAIDEEENNKKDYKKYHNLFSLIGLILILASLKFFEKETPHPSFYTLIPVIGVSFIIKYSNEKFFLTKILSSKPFVLIGLISYSLYLWHYVIFAFYRITASTDATLLHRFIIVILVFLFSFFSYFFVEKIFRSKKIINFKKLILSIILSIIIIISLNIYIIINKGFENRMIVNGVNLDNQFLKKERDDYLDKIKNKTFDKSNKIKILIIGNSFGGDLFSMFKLNKEFFSDFNFAYIDTQISCLSNENNIIDKQECGDLNINKIDNFINDADYIILSSKWYNRDIKILDRLINKLENQNKKIILSNNPPEFSVYGNFTIIDRFIFDNQKLPNEIELISLKKKYYSKLLENKKILRINKNIERIAKKNKLPVLNRVDLICDYTNQECEFFTNSKNKLFYDPGHTTLKGAKYLGEKILLKKLLGAQ